MLRSKPRFKYAGLTIIMSNPSRMDTHRLLAGNGGCMFDNHCLRPEFNSMMCDVRVMEDNSPLLDGTKCILLLGESAMHKYLPETLGNSLNEMRGSLMYYKSIPCISSYLPQESVDPKFYERDNNPLSKDFVSDDSVSSDGEDEDEGDVKRHGKTKRANYCFWLKADVAKCKKILAGFVPAKSEVKYRIFPGADEVINVLTSHKNEFLYFDIETDYEDQNLQCFAFSFDGITIYSCPILDYNYHWAYTSVHYILRALAIAVRDNTLVAHNGATFDFFILAHKYHIPIHKTYDTMIAMHRCFPDIEKSLGHCVSYWTWEKFHKDEDSVAYRTQQQMTDRLRYCGKDVYTMYLVHQAITNYARTIPGLSESIMAGMRCIRPYLTATLQGIKVDEEKVAKMINENDRLMVQYNRMIEILIGEQGLRDIRGSRMKVGMFASSPKQCRTYLYELMGYRTSITSPDTGEPSTGKIALFKLALQHNNPVLTLINIFRKTKKETSRLRFLPWVDTRPKEYQYEINTSNTQINSNS